ncbi:hypothetical protein KI387_006171, partial [Taxus chinensis]
CLANFGTSSRPHSPSNSRILSHSPRLIDLPPVDADLTQSMPIRLNRRRFYPVDADPSQLTSILPSRCRFPCR